MTQKEIAIEFLKLASSGSVQEAYEKYVHPDFIHHNAYFNGDRKSLLLAMEEAHQKTPNRFLKVQHAFKEGEFVAVHSHIQQEDDTDIAAVHIFRFANDQIVELWDVGVAVPEDSPNENGVF